MNCQPAQTSQEWEWVDLEPGPSGATHTLVLQGKSGHVMYPSRAACPLRAQSKAKSLGSAQCCRQQHKACLHQPGGCCAGEGSRTFLLALPCLAPALPDSLDPSLALVHLLLPTPLLHEHCLVACDPGCDTVHRGRSGRKLSACVAGFLGTVSKAGQALAERKWDSGQRKLFQMEPMLRSAPLCNSGPHSQVPHFPCAAFATETVPSSYLKQ